MLLTLQRDHSGAIFALSVEFFVSIQFAFVLAQLSNDRVTVSVCVCVNDLYVALIHLFTYLGYSSGRAKNDRVKERKKKRKRGREAQRATEMKLPKWRNEPLPLPAAAV